MKKFFSEFKKFITRGNVLDLAVGVIIGGAFTAIVNALSNHVLKPIINWFLALIFGKNSLSELFTFLKKAYTADGQLDLTQSIYINWGEFINAIINFLLTAIVLFIIVKTINKISERHEKYKENYLMEKAAVKKYRKEGLTKKQAVEKYAAELKAEAEAKAEAERIAAEAEANKLSTTDSLLVEIKELMQKNNELLNK